METAHDVGFERCLIWKILKNVPSFLRCPFVVKSVSDSIVTDAVAVQEPCRYCRISAPELRKALPVVFPFDVMYPVEPMIHSQ